MFRDFKAVSSLHNKDRSLLTHDGEFECGRHTAFALDGGSAGYIVRSRAERAARRTHARPVSGVPADYVRLPGLAHHLGPRDVHCRLACFGALVRHAWYF